MTSPFQDALRAELVTAARRDRRRRRGRIAGAVTAAAAAAAGSVALLWPSPAAADVEVRFRGDDVVVSIVDLQTDPDEVRDAMEDAGLAAEVVGAPTGPSAVGRFAGVSLTAPGPVPVTTSGSDGVTFDGFVVPRDYPGTILITVGVPAEPGQMYDVGTDALAPGEPLACRAVVGRTVADLPPLSGLEVRVIPQPASSPIAIDAPEVDPYLGWYVTGARATSRASVVLLASADPVPRQDPTC